MLRAVLKEIESLRYATVTQLKDKYREVFGEETRSNHKEFLFRRIAWRLQARAEGDLSERARRRALEIADDADLRVRAPLDYVPGKSPEIQRATVRSLAGARDPRVPQAGTLLTREFQGRPIIVKVLADGFEYEGSVYRSLTAIACQVAGTRWNGYTFFGLDTPKRSNHARKN
jgi:hypothetical protein